MVSSQMDPFTDSSSSLKSAQLNAIYRMLDFNGEYDNVGGSRNSSNGFTSQQGMNHSSTTPNHQPHHRHHPWKILIYDTTCRSIISPILSVQQLRRKCNVTLHLLLHSDRECIPDVPAIYFVLPTKENLIRIAQDSYQQLYANMYLNFVTKLERPLMEEFAKLLLQSSTSTGSNNNNTSSSSLSQIASIHDQYLNYICYENSLFTLNINNSYIQYNNNTSSETMIDTYMTHISYGLFSVIASYNQIPIIRCPKGGAPEMVARKLNRMIIEHPTLLQNASHSSSSSSGRPLLVILDRNSDLITPIQHCSTYQALIDDVLTHKANRVEFEISPDASKESDKNKNRSNVKKILKKYDLDPDTDPFYSLQKFVPFPEAIEHNDSELKDVTHREQMIRSKSTTTSTPTTTAAPDPFNNVGGGASDLANAVDSLPILIERKKQLEVHTSILQGVMNEVAARDVPQFYDIESSLATGTYKNDLPKAKKDVLTLVSDPAKGNVHDKLRLVLVYALATNAKTADIDEVMTAFQQVMELKTVEDKSIGPIVAAGMKAIAYVKQLRLMHMIPSANDMLQELQLNKSDTATTTTTTASSISSFMAKATTQATGFLAKATDRVSSMLGKIHKHHATVVTEHLCDYTTTSSNSQISEDETYLYLDPKVKGDVNVQQLRNISRPPIHHAIVFMIGGGCYNEYQNIQSLLSNERRSICYGSTELLDPNSFVQQLGQLG